MVALARSPWVTLTGTVNPRQSEVVALLGPACARVRRQRPTAPPAQPFVQAHGLFIVGVDQQLSIEEARGGKLSSQEPHHAAAQTGAPPPGPDADIADLGRRCRCRCTRPTMA